MIKHYCDRCTNEIIQPKPKQPVTPHITIFFHKGGYQEYELCIDCEKEVLDFLKLGSTIVLSARAT